MHQVCAGRDRPPEKSSDAEAPGRPAGGNPFFTAAFGGPFSGEPPVDPALFCGPILDHTDSIVYVKDLQGRYLLVNRRYEEVFRLRHDQILGRTDRDLFPRASADAFRLNDLRVAETGRTIEFRETADGPDGRRTYSSIKFPIRDDDGGIVAVAGISNDVTRAARAERALKRLQERNSAILDSTDDGVLCLDRRGRLFYSNPAAARLLGDGRPLPPDADEHRLFHHTGPAGRPRPRHDCPIRAVVADGRSRRVEADLFWRLDGRPLPVSYTCSPLREGDRVTGAVVVFRDLTELRRHERAEHHLRAAETVQRRLLPTAAPRVAGFDIAGAAYPAERTCGDYFDFVPLPDGDLCLAVGDVSGHGLGAALHMVETRAALRCLLRTAGGLDEVLRQLNRLLHADLPEGAFVTLFLAALDPASRTFRYAAAAHEARLIRGDGTAVRLRSTATLLGLAPEIEVTLSDPCRLAPGDTLFIPTDGVTEAQTPAKDLFGWDRAVDLLRLCRDESAADTIDTLYRVVRHFSRDRPPLDDLTLVVAKAV